MQELAGWSWDFMRFGVNPPAQRVSPRISDIVVFEGYRAGADSVDGAYNLSINDVWRKFGFVRKFLYFGQRIGYF
ncbi:hypothetical protein DSO57_1017237 [Entomophthora muscae]|uniref:Uncharacterized protein n=1 Tax=Entomophthora muscae TaxID=34485 RepID=A0ACC2STF1_9FUNG|nr:hypothetical protein DSO57_1017237 [Entomophthora muscae]